MDQVVAGVVGDLNQHPQPRKLGEYFGHSLGERGVVDQGGRARIRQQILQFAFDIAEVDVEGSHARLKGAEQRLDEFVSVVGV